MSDLRCRTEAIPWKERERRRRGRGGGKHRRRKDKERERERVFKEGLKVRRDYVKEKFSSLVKTQVHRIWPTYVGQTPALWAMYCSIGAESLLSELVQVDT